jgi:hypothetical protein
MPAPMPAHPMFSISTSASQVKAHPAAPWLSSNTRMTTRPPMPRLSAAGQPSPMGQPRKWSSKHEAQNRRTDKLDLLLRNPHLFFLATGPTGQAESAPGMPQMALW